MRSKLKRILQLVLNEIAEIYLYFLTFYLICLILSLFFERWKLFFNWKAFHFSVVILGLLSLISDRGRQWILSQRKLVEFKKAPMKRKRVPIKVILKSLQDSASLSKAPMKRMLKGLKAFAIFTMVLIKEILKTFLLFVRVFAVFMKEIVKSLAGFVKLRITELTERLSKKDYIKVGITIIILAYTLDKGVAPINFLILVYALISIFWIIGSRIAAGLALVSLVSCPVLLILKKEILAETMAIYAFYFLVIYMVTQIREYASRASRPRKFSTG